MKVQRDDTFTMSALQPFILLCLLHHTLSGGQFDYVRPIFSPDTVRNYTLRIERNLCVDQPYKYFELLTCTNRLIRNQPSQTHIVGRFRTLQDVVFCRYKVYYRFRTYQPFLIDEWFNYCDAYDNLDGVSSIGLLAIGGLKTTIPDLPGCPFGGMINVTHTINEAQFPPFMPAGQYRMDMKFYNAQNETLFAVQTYLTVRAKGAVDLTMG
ncbi:hypothetical protein pipiens_002230 [Culex pipiens pipiens]|uniref:Uncharacterized protein n=1 Tax=Culex pipiens pipiens TaxID=38569 RepID=A0ABD1DLK6_CULPP